MEGPPKAGCDFCHEIEPKTISNSELVILRRLYCYFQLRMTDDDEIISHTSLASTFCTCQINKYLLIDFQPNEDLKETTPQKNARTNYYSDKIQEDIRNKIYELSKDNNFSVTKILDVINKDGDFPEFSRSTLYRLMKDIGIHYIQSGNNKILIDFNGEKGKTGTVLQTNNTRGNKSK